MIFDMQREINIKYLYILMSSISEDNYAAGWHVDTQYQIWNILMEHEVSWYVIKPEAQLALLWLSQNLDGWHDGERFVPMVEWLSRFEKWKNQRDEWIAKREAELGKKD